MRFKNPIFYILSLLCWLNALDLKSQSNNTTNCDTIYSINEMFKDTLNSYVIPKYIGGQDSLYMFLLRNHRDFPINCGVITQRATCYVEFNVDKNGNPFNLTTLKIKVSFYENEFHSELERKVLEANVDTNFIEAEAYWKINLIKYIPCTRNLEKVCISGMQLGIPMLYPSHEGE